ncbi:MAG TPA: ATP-binding protein [Magnetospirillum sp.]|nr:ATP-binding protein [Magnetospirillum sp.]
MSWWQDIRARTRVMLAGSIRRRLVVSIAVVHAVLMTLFVADLIHRQLTFLKGQSHTRAEGLARIIAVNSVSWVLADDVRGLSEVVRSLRSHPHLMYAMVVDPRGQVLAHTDRDRIGFYVSDPLSMDILSGPPALRTVVESTHMVEVATPVMAQNRVIGWARVALDQQEEIANIRSTMIEGIFYIFSAIVVGTVCALWISRRLTADFLQLGEAVDQMRKGKRDIKSLDQPAQEIARVEQAFVAMAETIWRREDELRHTINQLAASNTDLERFAYIASHDLQEPLRTVVGFAQLLERRYKGKLDADADQFIDFIVEGGKRMSMQIQGLLEFSRIDAKGQAFKNVDMGPVLQSALDNLADALRQSDAEISVGALPRVHGDEIQLMLLFQNILSNAIKFRRPDQRPLIRVECASCDGMAEFRISDNGIGIDPSRADEIFMIFRRLHNSAQYSGRGIGLAICRRIVERHGGSIRAEALPQGGTCFICALPMAIEGEATDADDRVQVA